MRIKGYMFQSNGVQLAVHECVEGTAIAIELSDKEGNQMRIVLDYDDAQALKEVLPGYAHDDYRLKLDCERKPEPKLEEEAA